LPGISHSSTSACRSSSRCVAWIIARSPTFCTFWKRESTSSRAPLRGVTLSLLLA
jgi:hypothetical protein